MTDLLRLALEQALANSWLELTAVMFGVAYLLLAMRENILCWLAALISTVLFLLIFWQVKLYMESGLQVYYIIMAVYGWYQWRSGTDNEPLAIQRWPLARHLFVIAATLLISGISGYALTTLTDARFPYLDSFTTWGAIVTTYMVATKVLENWIYWFVLDGLSIYLYLDRELYFTALLFLAYIVIVIFGYLAWNRRYLKQAPG